MARLFLAVFVLCGLGACADPHPACEHIAGLIHQCNVYGDRAHEVYVAGTVDAPPSQDYIRLLARGVTGGPNEVAVDTCAVPERVYLLEGLFAVDTTSGSFEVEDLTGNFAGTREAVRSKRDSLFAVHPSCLTRDRR